MANADDNVLVVRWDQHHTDLKNRLYGYFTEKAFVDVTLWCLDRRFKAHRVLLSACSEYFERVLLEQTHSGAEPVSVVLHGVEPDDVAGLLELIYRGEARVPATCLPRFFACARALGVRVLQSASLRVQPAGPDAEASTVSRPTGSPTSAEEKELCPEFKHLNDGEYFPLKKSDRNASIIPSMNSFQQPEKLKYSTKNRLTTSKEQLSLVGTVRKDLKCQNNLLGDAEIPILHSSRGIFLQRALQIDATALKVERDRTLNTWRSSQALTPVASVQAQRTIRERNMALTQATLPAVSAGGQSDLQSIVPQATLEASVGISRPEATLSDQRLLLQIPRPQELSTDVKSLDDTKQATVKKLDWGASDVFDYDKPKPTEKVTDKTHNSHTYSKQQFSPVEMVREDKYSPKQYLRDAETLPAEPPLGSFKQELQETAPLVENMKSTETWSSCKPFSPVVLVLHQQTSEERSFPLSQTPPPPPIFAGLQTDCQAAVPPVPQARSGGLTLTDVQLTEVQAPQATLPVQGCQQQSNASNFTSLQCGMVLHGEHLFTLRKMPPLPSPNVVSFPVSEPTPPESPHSDNRQQTVKNEHNVEDELQLIRNEFKNDANNNQQNLEEQEPNQRRKQNVCADCGKICATQHSLKKHMRTHTGERPYLCAQCGKTFRQERNLRYHMSLHSGSREFAATCSECGKTFNNRNYLSSHMKIHRNQREYACQVCGRRFNQQVAFSMHARIHSGHRPHACSLCDKAFSRKVLLRHHMRTHTGEKPFPCQVCDKHFSDRSNMMVHARSHWGIKPYRCDHCGRAFTQRSNLRTHMATHQPLVGATAAQNSTNAPDTPAPQRRRSQAGQLRTTSVILKTSTHTPIS